MAMQTSATLSLAPGPNTVSRALEWLDANTKSLGWSQHTTFKLRLCLDEALSNIVMYGFSQSGPTREGKITLTFQAQKHQCVLEIMDNGLPFDPTEKQPAALPDTLDEAQLGGHGLRLMRHYLQDVQYRRNNRRNQLRLVADIDTGPSSS